MNTISILSPVFNEARFVEEAMRSVAKYDGKSLVEHVLIDDRSTDGSFELMEALAWELSSSSQKAKFIVRRNPKKGKNAALNYAYTISSGQFFVLFAGDDLICAENLEERIEPLLAQKTPAVSQAALEIFLHGKEDSVRRFPRVGGGNKSGGAVSMNTAFAEHYFPIPEELPNEDTWLQAVIVATQCETIDVNTIALAARVHENNSWNRAAKFDEYHAVMSRRNAAYAMAYKKFRGEAGKGLAKLNALCTAETYRIRRQPLAILFMPRLNLREKIHFIVGASRLVFDIRAAIVRMRSRTAE